jgi:hypothetical protein
VPAPGGGAAGEGVGVGTGYGSGTASGVARMAGAARVERLDAVNQNTDRPATGHLAPQAGDGSGVSVGGGWVRGPTS